MISAHHFVLLSLAACNKDRQVYSSCLCAPENNNSACLRVSSDTDIYQHWNVTWITVLMYITVIEENIQRFWQTLQLSS